MYEQKSYTKHGVRVERFANTCGQDRGSCEATERSVELLCLVEPGTPGMGDLL